MLPKDLSDFLVEIVLIASGSIFPVRTAVSMLVSYGTIEGIYIRSTRQLRDLASVASATLNDLLGETSDGMQHIRSFGWQASFRQRVFAALDQSQTARYQLYSLSRWLNVVTDIIAGATAVVLVRALSSSRETVSTLATGLALHYLLNNNISASRHIKLVTSFVLSLSSVRHIDDFMTATPQEQDVAAEHALPEVWPSAGKLEFNALTACYKLVLERIS